jgi:hypothetical protein
MLLVHCTKLRQGLVSANKSIDTSFFVREGVFQLMSEGRCEKCDSSCRDSEVYMSPVPPLVVQSIDRFDICVPDSSPKRVNSMIPRGSVDLGAQSLRRILVVFGHATGVFRGNWRLAKARILLLRGRFS